ncbi:hypothetical protein C5O19_22065 [Siphonobacter curvatus]|uniref:Uncharacterized protein n=1 Tax=Siphonobacter curvatus TaxID=2094562 RepID=A0A2S7IG87_9BACT|nr:hypothetical protein C5O19_22065 [Siphonobacter curvatus]
MTNEGIAEESWVGTFDFSNPSVENFYKLFSTLYLQKYSFCETAKSETIYTYNKVLLQNKTNE